METRYTAKNAMENLQTEEITAAEPVMPTLLRAEFAKFKYWIFKNYQRLPVERKLELHERWNRHLWACKKSGVDTDPHFIPQIVDDLTKGHEI